MGIVTARAGGTQVYAEIEDSHVQTLSAQPLTPRDRSVRLILHALHALHGAIAPASSRRGRAAPPAPCLRRAPQMTRGTAPAMTTGSRAFFFTMKNMKSMKNDP